MDWNDRTIGSLRGLWAEGHSTSEIGRRLGTTKNSIVGKVARLDLPARPSPIKRLSDDERLTRITVERPSRTLPPLQSEKEDALIPPGATHLAKLRGLSDKYVKVNRDYGEKATVFIWKISQEWSKFPVGYPSRFLHPLPGYIPVLFAIPHHVEPAPRPIPIIRRDLACDDGLVGMGPSLRPCQWVVRDGSVIVPWVHCGVDRAGWPYCADHKKLAHARPQARSVEDAAWGLGPLGAKRVTVGAAA